MINFLNFLIVRNDVKILLVFIVFDTIFGILRAIHQRKLNSNIGIDGIIRKAGMLISMLFFSLVDYIMKIDLIAFIPNELKEFLKLDNIGISHLFILLFIIFEILSVLKNMTQCKLPIPKKFQKFLEKLMKEFTKEIEEKEGEKDVKAE